MADGMVCMSAKALARPHVPSVRERCSKCGQQVWIDKKLLSLARTMRVLCVACSADPRSWQS